MPTDVPKHPFRESRLRDFLFRSKAEKLALSI
jgi:hypothetical protein